MTPDHTTNLSNPEAQKMVVVVVVVVVLVVVIVLINQSLYMAKLLNVARNIDGSLVIKPILFLRFLQQLHKQRMIDVNHGDYDPLLLLSLTHHNCYAPLGNIFLPMVMMMMEMGNM